MDEDPIEEEELSTRNQFIVMLAGSIVAFIAGKATEKLVTSALRSRRDHTAEEVQQ